MKSSKNLLTTAEKTEANHQQNAEAITFAATTERTKMFHQYPAPFRPCSCVFLCHQRLLAFFLILPARERCVHYSQYGAQYRE